MICSFDSLPATIVSNGFRMNVIFGVIMWSVLKRPSQLLISLTVLIASGGVFMMAEVLCGEASRNPPSFHNHPKTSVLFGNILVLSGAILMFADCNLQMTCS